MKNNAAIAILVAILLLIALGIAVITPAPIHDDGALQDSEFGKGMHYACADGKIFLAEFGDGLARITLEDGTSYTLESTVSASGARYANENDEFVFLSKDYGGFIEENGVETYSECALVTVGTEISRIGTVSNINKEQAMYDGPILITLLGTDGKESVISVPTMGLPTCAAYKAGFIRDPYTIEPGMTLEVAGTVAEDSTIIPCESETHYLR